MSTGDDQTSGPYTRLPMPLPLPPIEAGAERSLGCGRVGLIGCAVMMLLLTAASVLLVSRVTDVLIWALQTWEGAIVERIAPEVGPAERTRLRGAFQSLYDSLREGDVQVEALQRMQRQVLAAMEKDEIDSAELELLTRSIEAAAGVEPSAEATPEVSL